MEASKHSCASAVLGEAFREGPSAHCRPLLLAVIASKLLFPFSPPKEVYSICLAGSQSWLCNHRLSMCFPWHRKMHSPQSVGMTCVVALAMP